MDLRERLTEKELEYITDYRYNYVSSDNHAHWADSKTILGEWSDAKQGFGVSANLYKLLGEELMVTKQVSIDMPTNLLRKSVEDNATISTFIRKMNEAMRPLDLDPIVIIGVNSLLSLDSLTTNVYNDASFTAEYNGKKIKVQTGCKPVRMLKKFVELFGMDEAQFEEFRLEQSLTTNQRKITGELCLSIHPLDYMTMSDNESGWKSCMSWIDHGCYCRGTVEMMNSPYVVVGYLKDAAHTLGGWWNSKKWRSLFIVTPTIIQAIKAYPYQSDDLTMTCLDELKRLAEANWGAAYSTDAYKYDGTDIHIGSERREMNYSTNTMYNDFGTLEYHLCYPSLDVVAGHNYDKYLNYSGEEQCMVCGSFGEDFEDEGALACYNCCDCGYTCDCCGERISEDQITWVEGDCVCNDCLESECFYDEVADEWYYCTHETALYVVQNDEERNFIINNHDYNLLCDYPLVSVNLNNGVLNRYVCSNFEMYDGGTAITTLEELANNESYSYFGYRSHDRLVDYVCSVFEKEDKDASN